MGRPILTVDLDAIVANWQALDLCTASGVETAAVVKADGYSLGAAQVAAALARAGVRTFFVAVAEEGAAVRQATGVDAEVFVFSGHMEGDAELLRSHDLVPLLNSPSQVRRHLSALPDRRYGIQLDSGMSRLGMTAAEFSDLRDAVFNDRNRLVMSHLACADEPGNPRNREQLEAFKTMTDGLGVRRSLAATGGILLGADYQFDLCRPGIGLYGGAPFVGGVQAVTLDVPVIQVREVETDAFAGYGADWVARQPSKIATVAIGYADGMLRSLGGESGLIVWAGHTPCPVVGRISMDLVTVDVTELEGTPETVGILNDRQTIDDLARIGGTIGHEILTSLGSRYSRRYRGG